MPKAANGGTDLTVIKNDRRAALGVLLRELASYVHVACKGSMAALLTSGFPIYRPVPTPAGVLPAPAPPVLSLGTRIGELVAWSLSCTLAGGDAGSEETRAPRVERAARPSLPAARRQHFAQRTRPVNRTPRRRFHGRCPTRAASANGRAARSTRSVDASTVASADSWLTVPESKVHDRL